MKRPFLASALCAAVLLPALAAASCAGHSPSPPPSPTPSPASSSTPTFGATLNVRSFGATGNGDTNDSVAVQNAVNQAAAAHGTVYLPAGTYLCSTPIELADHVRVRGEGDASWIKGQMVFASDDRVERLKMGDAGRSACLLYTSDAADDLL